MKSIELIELNEKLLQIMAQNDITVNDIQHIEMYREVKKLKTEGNKVAYIASLMATRYKLTVRSVHRIVKRLDKTILL